MLLICVCDGCVCMDVCVCMCVLCMCVLQLTRVGGHLARVRSFLPPHGCQAWLEAPLSLRATSPALVHTFVSPYLGTISASALGDIFILK